MGAVAGLEADSLEKTVAPSTRRRRPASSCPPASDEEGPRSAGRLVPRPPDLRESNLLTLFRAALDAGVFSAEFRSELKAIPVGAAGRELALATLHRFPTGGDEQAREGMENARDQDARGVRAVAGQPSA